MPFLYFDWLIFRSQVMLGRRYEYKPLRYKFDIMQDNLACCIDKNLVYVHVHYLFTMFNTIIRNVFKLLFKSDLLFWYRYSILVGYPANPWSKE